MDSLKSSVIAPLVAVATLFAVGCTSPQSSTVVCRMSDDVSAKLGNLTSLGEWDKAYKLVLPYAACGDRQGELALALVMSGGIFVGDRVENGEIVGGVLDQSAAKTAMSSDMASVPERIRALEATAWMRLAAKHGSIEAASILATAFRFGHVDVGFSKDMELAECWDAVAANSNQAQICIALEIKKHEKSILD